MEREDTYVGGYQAVGPGIAQLGAIYELVNTGCCLSNYNGQQHTDSLIFHWSYQWVTSNTCISVTICSIQLLRGRGVPLHYDF